MIKDLHIKNYRAFKDLHLNELGQVNLIVGTNNSGKSSLLEAIHLMSSEDMRESLVLILSERGEFVSRNVDARFDRTRIAGYQVAHLFHGRSLEIGSISEFNSKSAGIKFGLTISETRRSNERAVGQSSLFDEIDGELDAEERFLTLFIERRRRDLGPEIERLRLDDGLLSYRSAPRSRHRPSSGSRLVTTNYLRYDELALLWDSITLTPQEDNVVEALRILEPSVERISFTSNQTSNSGILVRLANEAEPIPLGSMGDGMRRVLAIIASLVSVGDGNILVDEIDTGLYYGVLSDMWQLIIRTAKKQGAQVFATTHSWDCVRAFQQALSIEGDDNVGRLIRLERENDRFQPVSYSSQELDIAISQGIEVR